MHRAIILIPGSNGLFSLQMREHTQSFTFEFGCVDFQRNTKKFEWKNKQEICNWNICMVCATTAHNMSQTFRHIHIRGGFRIRSVLCASTAIHSMYLFNTSYEIVHRIVRYHWVPTDQIYTQIRNANLQSHANVMHARISRPNKTTANQTFSKLYFHQCTQTISLLTNHLSTLRAFGP